MIKKTQHVAYTKSILVWVTTRLNHMYIALVPFVHKYNHCICESRRFTGSCTSPFSNFEKKKKKWSNLKTEEKRRRKKKLYNLHNCLIFVHKFITWIKVKILQILTSIPSPHQNLNFPWYFDILIYTKKSDIGRFLQLSYCVLNTYCETVIKRSNVTHPITSIFVRLFNYFIYKLSVNVS